MLDLLVVGPVFADMVFAGIPALPQPGQEIYSKDFALTGGGAFITAVAAKRLGLQVALITTLGADPVSQLLTTMLQAEGVDTRLIKTVSMPAKNVTVSMNYDGDRAMLSYSDAIDHRIFEEHLTGVLATVRANWVHLPAVPAHVLIPSLAHQHGAKVSLDVGWDADWLRDPALRGMIAEADLFLPNALEALTMTGASDVASACDELSTWGSTITVVTDGERGVTFKAIGGKVERISAPLLDQVKDTTGAGDNFSAAILYGLIKGYPLNDAVRIGVHCGSESVRGLGGNATSPHQDALREWMFRSGMRYSS